MDGSYESEIKSQGFNLIIGVDESGRGPLAGPVVASAVSLKSDRFQARVDDSKLLTDKLREEAFHEIYDKAYIGIGIISETVIDRGNILDATFLAMTNAVENLIVQYNAQTGRESQYFHDTCLLVDGNLFRSEMPYPYRTIVKGDKSVLSIACASIVAKVTRDRILDVYDRIYPQYGFSRHKGYGTVAHKQAIKDLGPSLIHRRTFNSSL